jgi:hypothetical protein
MAARRLRLLVNSVSAGIRYIGTSRSKSAGPEYLQNESRAGKGGRMIEKSIPITADLTDAGALALAQSMKRVGFNVGGKMPSIATRLT